MKHRIHQLLIGHDPSGPKIVATSSDLPLEAQEACRKLVASYSSRPPGAFSALFACPLAGQPLRAVVRVVDDPANPSNTLFRFLLVHTSDYASIGDPFLIDDTYPVDWMQRGNLPVLEAAWPAPNRTIAEAQAAWEKCEPALLLGTIQKLIDGGRVALHRPSPDEEFVRAVWTLLPWRSRSELWPATFAGSTDLGCHLVVLPPGTQPGPGYGNEDDARDYPEGRYEAALEIAIKSGNQAELDRLFARATSQQMFRLAMTMLGLALLVSILVRLFLR